MTLSVRRTVAVLAAGAALVTAGCGSPDSGPDRAAVVDGEVISETDLRSAMNEINEMEPALLEQELTPSGTLTALVQAPVVLEYLAGKGVVVSDSVATREAERPRRRGARARPRSRSSSSPTPSPPRSRPARSPRPTVPR